MTCLRPLTWLAQEFSGQVLLAAPPSRTSTCMTPGTPKDFQHSSFLTFCLPASPLAGWPKGGIDSHGRCGARCRFRFAPGVFRQETDLSHNACLLFHVFRQSVNRRTRQKAGLPLGFHRRTGTSIRWLRCVINGVNVKPPHAQFHCSHPMRRPTYFAHL